LSQGSTLYRFRISLCDIDHSVYDDLDLRVARHSSESDEYLITRVLAYSLNFKEGLRFSQGLADPDEAAIQLPNHHGSFDLLIEIGNPTARRLHRASKTSSILKVYTYKDPENLKREANGQSIHRAKEIEIYSLDPKFLKDVAESLGRENTWTVMLQEGELTVSVGEESFKTTPELHRIY
jgi:uncharacterized protein YaeQ